MLNVSEIRGLQTAWLEDGKAGKPILLALHGFPDDPHVWDFQTAHFRKRFHIIRPFARGLSPSEPAKELGRYGTDAMSLDCLGILKKIDPEGNRPVILLGHDLGAAHAWNLAPLLGHRLKGLIVINGLSIAQMARRIRNPRQHLRSWYIYFLQIPGVPEAMARRFPLPLRRLAYRMGELADVPEESSPGATLIRPLRQYRAFVRELPRALKKRPPRLGAKVLVLWGSRDPFLLPPSLDELEPFAHAPTVRILDSNHWLQRTEREKVNSLLASFCDSLPA